MFNKLKK